MPQMVVLFLQPAAFVYFLLIDEVNGQVWYHWWEAPGYFSWVLPKRSIPKADQHRKDIIQQELLAQICYRN